MEKEQEQLAAKYLNDKIKKTELFNPKIHCQSGNMLFFTYNPKLNEPYDKYPLVLVISDKNDKFLGINFHWAPKPLRIKIIKEFMKENYINIKNDKPVQFPDKISDHLYKMISPIFRLYFKNRVSKKIAVIPPQEMGYVVNLKAEKFIGVTSETAYATYYQKQQATNSFFK